MKKTRPVLFVLCLLLFITTAFSCGETAPTTEVRLLDSLNNRAYSLRYKNIDSSYQTALNAYLLANHYDKGMAEACNNLGFCRFMQMDFEVAVKLYHEVYDCTVNELELLIADIGLMKVYQRTAMNKEYYDSRNSAIRRMKRINEDSLLFVDVHETKRLNYAKSEFNIVSAIYYYYLQQKPEAIASINEIKETEAFLADTAQYLYSHYIKGSAGLTGSNSNETQSLKEFDELLITLLTASGSDYIYFEANALQGLSNLLNDEIIMNLVEEKRPHALRLLKDSYCLSSDLLPLRLAQLALIKFKKYEDVYQIAGTYVSIGQYYNTHGQYAEALDSLSHALACVNYHHRRYYTGENDSVDVLKLYSQENTACRELSWINHKEVKTVPEWIARIREQLSVSYAGLGMKLGSDYNRNVLLDILNNTRQDKELESRYQALEKEDKKLNMVSLSFFIGLILLIFLFWIFNSRSKQRNRKHIERLRLTLDVCQKITASIPSDANSEEDIISAISLANLEDMQLLFGISSFRIKTVGSEENEEQDVADKRIKSVFNLTVPDKTNPIGQLELYSQHKLSKDEKALANIITPYIAWTLNNGLMLISLSDERHRLDKQRYVYEQHIRENKRQNLVKKACLAIANGINPFMDRVINEVSKLMADKFFSNETMRKDKYAYIDELITKINEYNDILALWIKTKQGSLSLNIENFPLSELFDVVAKGRKTFEMKQQSLQIAETNEIVKADRALTLFMINTLMDNARKYTPQGGIVKIEAKGENNYVEISIEDTGMGLSQEDIARIVGEKVYDSGQIGMSVGEDAEELKKNKGSGFGLMNCRGIIEKYRKTNEIFNVCRFNVESELGKGSRFSFRLPIGIRKTLLLWLCVFTLGNSFVACTRSAQTQSLLSQTDSLAGTSNMEYDQLLSEASLFADSAYYSNVEGNYPLTLQYIDSAMSKLNTHYLLYSGSNNKMELKGRGTPAEIDWWNKMFDTDFHIILDIRNEAAVAFLGIKDWEAYKYNNAAYSALYKLLGEDFSLAEYCRSLEHSTNNKEVGMLLCIVLLLVLLVGYYFIYLRKPLLYRRNLEQILEINRQIFAASLVPLPISKENVQEEEISLNEIPQRIVDDVFDAVNELLIINKMAIAVFNEDTQKLECVFNHSSELPAEDKEKIEELMKNCFAKQTFLSHNDIGAMPLLIEVGETSRCVGVLTLIKEEGIGEEADRLLLELIARYVGIVVFNAVVKLANSYRDIESTQDEVRRASWEDGLLHIQNMVLDNCLSTIKHETIYYPNKIKQIIDKLNSGAFATLNEEKENIKSINELIDYYKSIFTILSSCAARQLEAATFRRSTIEVDELFTATHKYFKKAVKRISNNVELCLSPSNLKISGDDVQLKYLLENLIDEALSFAEDGRLNLEAITDGEYVRFLFTDSRRERSTEQLNLLFYPSLSLLTTDDEGRLRGTEYLLCKQIVREHDEFAGRRGCRINAESCPQGGFTVYFTIPKR
ncbi:MAG: DUF5113 domain-containing protein [Bacteroidaceae bacterium]